jgi:8-oxo-dGTP pyrophosphatase MutT (NUDIX family)
VPFLLEKNMEKLAVETWAGFKVIPIVDNSTHHCVKCHFNNNNDDYYCDVIRCSGYERDDKHDVYFVLAESETLTINQQTYVDTEKRKLANSAAVIIHSKSGKLLTTTRRNTDILALPGGKEDPGENALQAIVRETAEETGLNLRPELFVPIFSEIVVGNDGRDFYCTTFVYKTAIDESLFAESWSVEDGIKVSFQTWENLYTGAFVEYNKKAEENFRRWQATQ